MYNEAQGFATPKFPTLISAATVLTVSHVGHVTGTQPDCCTLCTIPLTKSMVFGFPVTSVCTQLVMLKLATMPPYVWSSHFHDRFVDMLIDCTCLMHLYKTH